MFLTGTKRYLLKNHGKVQKNLFRTSNCTLKPSLYRRFQWILHQIADFASYFQHNMSAQFNSRKSRHTYKINYNVNSSHFGQHMIEPLRVTVPEQHANEELIPLLIQFPVIITNQDHEKIPFCNVIYKNDPKQKEWTEELDTLLLSERFYCSKLANYILLHIDESLHDHNLISQYMDDLKENTSTVCSIMLLGLLHN